MRPAQGAVFSLLAWAAAGVATAQTPAVAAVDSEPHYQQVVPTPPAPILPPTSSPSASLEQLEQQAEAQRRTMADLMAQLPAQPPGATPTAAVPQPPPPPLDTMVAQALPSNAQPVAANAQNDQDLRRQVQLLQRQIETQQKMIGLLMQQVRQGAAGPAVDKLQTQTATLEAQGRQAALRDVQVAHDLDNITEHQDAAERYGPELPATLKQLFDPSENNETQLSIYGALAFGYSKIIGDASTAANGAGRPSTPGGFYFGEFTPDFLLKLNDWIMLEAEIGVGPDGSVSAGSFAEADFFVNDWLTIIAGRFVAPIGFYNERLNNPWINKLPGDAPGGPPLPWLQVLPPLALLGVEAQGSFYIGCSPFKLEYAAYISNGMNVTPATAGAPTVDELANLENMTDTFSIISNDKAMGGRLGLWWPEMGLEAGFAAIYNGDYIAGGFENSISLWAVDLNYHKGNWDAHAEYGETYQQTVPFLANNIRRRGFYGQVAYRPYDACNPYIQNVELVYRYSYVDFSGIDPTTLDLTQYGTPIDVPTRRQQSEFGINYYFYPRMVLKVAYQINDEPNFHLHDNQFLTELAWGW
ncbi:MAG TPA: hypothetical protein VFA18_03325 [Gemmataceae bacterium]|nr:hypothetical protein [Gemmataceae bacterium]